jgi:hypothetical protein
MSTQSTLQCLRTDIQQDPDRPDCLLVRREEYVRAAWPRPARWKQTGEACVTAKTYLADTERLASLIAYMEDLR